MDKLNFEIGYVAAIKAGQKGLKVACVEKRGTLGGTCLNVGCIPSKALLNATHKFHDAQHEFKNIGIEATGLSMDFGKLMKSKEKAVSGLTSGIEFLFKKNKVDYIKGWGKFSGPNSIEIDGNDGKKSEISAKNIMIATGSEPSTLPKGLLDVDEKFVVTSTGALALQKVPKKMVVIGGGVIGLEMGSVYSRLGTEVTVVQNGERLCPSLDKEVTVQFQKILQKQGMKFLMNTAFKSGQNNGDKGVKLNLTSKDGAEHIVDTDVVLLSIGRRPFTQGLQLEKAGLTVNARG